MCDNVFSADTRQIQSITTLSGAITNILPSPPLLLLPAHTSITTSITVQYSTVQYSTVQYRPRHSSYCQHTHPSKHPQPVHWFLFLLHAADVVPLRWVPTNWGCCGPLNSAFSFQVGTLVLWYGSSKLPIHHSYAFNIATDEDLHLQVCFTDNTYSRVFK